MSQPGNHGPNAPDRDRESSAGLTLGGDVTGYLVPENLREAYGSPVSFHVFLHYRRGPAGRAGVTHVH